MGWQEWWSKYRVPMVITGLGIGLVILAIGLMLPKEETKIEIISGNIPGQVAGAAIKVDLQGAVEKPGVYELITDSRIQDLLIRAGGLSATADRDWVSQNLNLAQKLTDGQKLYIPFINENLKVENSLKTRLPDGQVENLKLKINVNTASLSELDILWGIGPARAQQIIDNRPYGTIEEAKTKAKIPSNVWEQIKDQITTY